jgi:hypothetical protein
MCDVCLPILGRYAKKHPSTPCPLEKALYCGVCACHGHSPARCSRRYVCPDIIDEATIELAEIPDIYVEISDAEGPVRAALIANGISPMVCQEKGKKQKKDFIENKKRLAKYVKERGKTLVLLRVCTVGYLI